MSQQTAPCPHCRMTNSYKSVNCLECGQQLPWGASVLVEQQQAQAAQQAAMAAQQAADTLAQRQAARGTHPRSSTAFVAPHSISTGINAKGPNDYSGLGSSFFREKTFENVEPGGALFIGGIAALLFVLSAGAGIYQWVQHILMPSVAFGNALNAATGSGTPLSPSFNSNIFFKCGLVPLAFLVGMLLLGTILRTIAASDNNGSIGNDLFVTGVAILPLGLWIMLSSFVGDNHQKILTITGVFAFCYSITLLHAGYTRVSQIKAAVATFCVPLFLLLNAWFCQFLSAKILN